MGIISQNKDLDHYPTQQSANNLSQLSENTFE